MNSHFIKREIKFDKTKVTSGVASGVTSVIKGMSNRFSGGIRDGISTFMAKALIAA